MASMVFELTENDIKEAIVLHLKATFNQSFHIDDIDLIISESSQDGPMTSPASVRAVAKHDPRVARSKMTEAYYNK